MHLDPKFIGKTFTEAANPSIEYTCEGYADGCGTIVIIGSTFDSLNNRTTLNTFKLTSVKFIGKF